MAVFSTSYNALKWSLAGVLTLGMTSVPLQSASAESMSSAVRHAVKSNPNRLAARENTRAAAHELEESQSQFMPKVRLFGDIGAEYVDNPASLSASDNRKTKATRQIGLSATYTIFDGYERANNVYRNAARLDASLYNLMAASETVALNAVEAYIDVVRHRDLLRISRANIHRHNRILRQIRERVRGGKSPESDEFQIRERVLAARAVEVEIKKALGEANAKYRRVVGRSPGKRMRIPGVRHLPRSMNSLVNSAVANNVEIKNNSKQVSEAEYARDASRAGLAPRIFVEGRTTAGADRSGSRGDEFDAYLGLKMTWDIFDGGTTEARENALAARAGEAAYRRDLKIREIRQAAELAWNAYVQGRKRNAILTAQLNANKRIVTNYRQEYELSKRSLLDVLDAERARFNSHFQQISVAASFRYAPYRMLATQSKLASHFGATTHVKIAKPTFETTVRQGSQSIFNINIEPLK